jgi:DNA-binding MarR family transcriptional regulator
MTNSLSLPPWVETLAYIYTKDCVGEATSIRDIEKADIACWSYTRQKLLVYLLNAEYIKKQKTFTDQRKTQITLTAKGRKVAEACHTLSILTNPTYKHKTDKI